MKKTPGPKLADLAAELRRQAAATGEDRSLTLSHGARIAYRYRAGRVWFSVARKDKPVGTPEEITFKAQCAVPAGARRIPAEGQRTQELAGATWHQIVWTWEDV